MQVILDEARESYNEPMVVELMSNGTEDLDSNIKRIETWIESWKQDNAAPDSSKDDDKMSEP